MFVPTRLHRCHRRLRTCARFPGNEDSNIARLVAWLQARAAAVTSDLACAEAKRNLAMKRHTPQWSVLVAWNPARGAAGFTIVGDGEDGPGFGTEKALRFHRWP